MCPGPTPSVLSTLFTHLSPCRPDEDYDDGHADLEMDAADSCTDAGNGHQYLPLHKYSYQITCQILQILYSADCLLKLFENSGMYLQL